VCVPEFAFQPVVEPAWWYTSCRNSDFRQLTNENERVIIYVYSISCSVRQREYIKTYDGFIDPDGNEVGTITNLAEFCRQHSLDNTHMVAVMNGRICSHRGWTHTLGRTRQIQKTYFGFVNPKGERVVITNLAEFCRVNALHPVKMHNLKSGRITRYKRWTWSNEDE
jgi:hypothetical protein